MIGVFGGESEISCSDNIIKVLKIKKEIIYAIKLS